MIDKDKKYLQNQVQRIADELTSGHYLGDILNINDCYINYIINARGDYCASRILVATNPPEIWINTDTNTVDGHQYLNDVSIRFSDTSDINDYMSGKYEAMKRGYVK